MWKYVTVSVRGSAHVINGLPCQDCGGVEVVGPDQSIVLCALSDGAGTAKFSDEASQFLITEAFRFFETQLADHPDPGELIAEYDLSDAESFLTVAQEGLQRMAHQRDASIREFSATLLFAAIHPTHSVFFQIGDGCWSVARNGVFGAVTWPIQGEFAGQTEFVTSRHATSVLQMEKITGAVDCVVGITDGLERLALDLQGRFPHPGFFAPLVAALEKTFDVEIFKKGLVAFLESERVCDRTDDDKSIIIVARDGSRV
jgi:protein phosphatase 2C-like protein